jgi:hypothetical protein
MRPRRKPFDPHATLGLAAGATHAEVRRAYRRRAMAIHPDVTGVDSTTEMARLNRARDELLARPGTGAPATGDDHGAAAPRSAERPPRPAWAAPYEAAWTNYWSAWNELPRWDRPDAAGPDGPAPDQGDPDRPTA